jgi:hypothetical protein
MTSNVIANIFAKKNFLFYKVMGRTWILPILLCGAMYLIINQSSTGLRNISETMAPFSKSDATTEVRDRVTSFVAEFNRVWDASFTYGQETRDTIRKLAGIAAQTQDALQCVKAALPSDTTLQAQWKQAADTIQSDHFAKLEDLRTRCGAPLLYPGPLDDMHYSKWWRAANYYDDVDGATSPV